MPTEKERGISAEDMMRKAGYSDKEIENYFAEDDAENLKFRLEAQDLNNAVKEAVHGSSVRSR